MQEMTMFDFMAAIGDPNKPIKISIENTNFDGWTILATGLFGALCYFGFEWLKNKLLEKRTRERKLLSNIQTQIILSLDNLSKAIDLNSKIFINDKIKPQRPTNLQYFFPKSKNLDFCSSLWILGEKLNISVDDDFNKDDFNFFICFSDLNTDIRLLKSILIKETINEKDVKSLKLINDSIIYYEKTMIDYYINILEKKESLIQICIRNQTYIRHQCLMRKNKKITD